MPPDDVQVCAGRRGEGANAHVWVEDEEWGPSVDDTGVAEILRRWDEETPAGSSAPDRGIFRILTGIFGDPPDEFDADPRIHILLLAMEGTGAAEFDGCFRPEDQAAGPHSNRREMIHVNTRTRHRVASPYMIGVMAHEFHHMLQWKHDPTEEAWLAESFAEAAMVLVGYATDLPAGIAWAHSPTAPLVAFGAGDPVDYGAAFLFGAYLLDRLSPGGVADLVADTRHGAESVAAAVRLVDPEAGFVDFLADFAMAVFLDDPGIDDGRYGFPGIDVSGAGATRVAFPAHAAPLALPGGGIKLARVPLDGAAHAAIGVDIDPGGVVSLGARAALVDPDAGTRVFAVTPGAHLVLRDVPETAAEILVALATEEELAVNAALTVADE
jgi:hypothetical protein